MQAYESITNIKSSDQFGLHVLLTSNVLLNLPSFVL